MTVWIILFGGNVPEFVTASGKTQALVTLNVNDVRRVQDSDLIAVRSVA